MLEFGLILAIASGLILFLYGMEQFSMEIQRVAGERFRSFIRSATKNPARGALLGAVVTALVQSSTAVAVITLGLVDSGVISFAHSLAIIFGAGIGTTITAQLVALNFTSLGIVFIPLGFLLSLFGGRFAFLGRPLFFFGFVYHSMGLVAGATAPLRDDPALVSYISTLSDVPTALLVGFIVTNLFQSSGVFTGLVVVLAGNGIIGVQEAIVLVLGSNIGTITPLISSFRLGLFAKRTAVAQFLYNVAGVLLILPFLPQFVSFIMSLGGSAAQQAANAHTISNIIATGAFLIVLQPFSKFVEKLVPGREEEILFQTVSLNDRLPEDNPKAFAAVEAELRHLLSNTIKVMERSRDVMHGEDGQAFRRLLKREALNDYLDERIEKALLELSGRALSPKEVSRNVLLLRMSNALEQIADLGVAMAYAANSMRTSGRLMSSDACSDVDAVHFRIMDDLGHLSANFPSIIDADVAAMRENDVLLREQINSAYSEHLKRLYSKKAYAPATFVKCMSRLESAHGKLREIRKLSELYKRP
ncbi:MAG: Na/Pi symporter [Candidatus Micrarchaeota archaeon]